MKRAMTILALVSTIAGGGYGTTKAIQHFRGKSPAEAPDSLVESDVEGAGANENAPTSSAEFPDASTTLDGQRPGARSGAADDPQEESTASDPFSTARRRYARPEPGATVRGQSDELSDEGSTEDPEADSDDSARSARYRDSQLTRATFTSAEEPEDEMAAETDSSGEERGATSDSTPDEDTSPRSRYGRRGGRAEEDAPGKRENRRPRRLEADDAEPIDDASASSEARARSSDRERGSERSAADSRRAHAGGRAARASAPMTREGGTGRPGGRLLEGPQNATLVVQKVAPAEVQVGIESFFEVLVRNSGQVAAHDVVVRDAVPEGMRLVSTEPEAEQGGGELVWRLESMAPGEERTFRVTLEPVAEGELGSVARVSYSAEASVRTLSTRPQLSVELASPGEVLIGQPIPLRIRVTNPGTGVATGVLIEASLPDGMRHDSGRVIESELGDLAPGESRDLELSVIAAKAGAATAILTARGDGDLEASEPAKVNIVAPELRLALEGSKRRFLDREATYVVNVTNAGTAPATNVDLAVQIPSGINFVKADNFGEYDPATRIVRWSLTELPPGESGQVTWSAMPTASGNHTIMIDGKADLNLVAHHEQTIQVDGVAAIKFEVVDVDDPVEIGGETTYEIHVVNQGSKAARRIELIILAPEGLRAVDAEGPVKHQLEPQRVLFDPLPELAPKADTVFRVKVVGERAGDHRLSVELTSDELTEPVTKQESTRVLPSE